MILCGINIENHKIDSGETVFDEGMISLNFERCVKTVIW